MSLETYAAFVAACIVIAIIPGPTVTLIVANSLRHGARAGLLNVAGTQLGLAIMVVVAAIGLTSLIVAAGHWFDWLRLAGAAYLVWLGWKMFRSEGIAMARAPAPPRGGFLLQGMVVSLSNPKILLFFGAFFPQFIDPNRDKVVQIVLMGVTALAVAGINDCTFAILASRAGRLLTEARSRLVARIGGACLIGGGVWLALARTR
ncbi:transporter [Kaistia sp. 32K]|uniref:LysE family translocator n=1 Tax=Kaistia sp. 32K TaxID=2795690 RepID=UPI001915D9C8|nr:LysE family translocator [Kaistia sp. 32K]BCP55377.1 transporter [Kaistia sp. 32K]